MILTCPSCQTKYVVKDGAIPPQGRQVRCANCKESWHQMPEGDAAAPLDAEAVPVVAAPETAHAAEPTIDGDIQVPAPTGQGTVSYQDFSDDVMASQRAGIAGEPVPDMDQPTAFSEEPAEAIAHSEVGGPPEPVLDEQPVDDYAMSAGPTAAYEVVEEPVAAAPEEDFAVNIPDDDDEPRGKGKLLLIIAVLLAIVAAAAWFFAPASLKSQLGIASSDKSPLELMVTTSDRQQLASGNELLAISGRVINPTGQEQPVPPIRAELRNKVSKKVVYQWTIAPPARSLPPGGSATFNSAEVDIPPGGDELTVTLANAAG